MASLFLGDVHGKPREARLAGPSSESRTARRRRVSRTAVGVAEHDRERRLAAHRQPAAGGIEPESQPLAAGIRDLGPALSLERELERDRDDRRGPIVPDVGGGIRGRSRRGRQRARRASRFALRLPAPRQPGQRAAVAPAPRPRPVTAAAARAPRRGGRRRSWPPAPACRRVNGIGAEAAAVPPPHGETDDDRQQHDAAPESTT